MQNQKKVLAQESDSDMRYILKIILEDAQFDVLIIAGYDRICEAIDNFQPQVVLMDYVLSGKPSIEACQKIKSRFQKLPIVAFSCNADINETYERSGFDDYVEKPFDIDHLCEVLIKNINKTNLDSSSPVSK